MTYGTLNLYSLLKINGADAASFLQGQLTNDVNLCDTQWQFTGYCSPKGRLIALLQLWKTDSNEFYALLSKDLTESVVKRLRMFVMRSKVEIDILEIPISGFHSLEHLVKVVPDSIEKIDQKAVRGMTILENNQTVLNIANQFLLINHLADLSEPFDRQWQEQNIMHGLPQVTLESTELFIPQMINLDLIEGINFKKGCYTGQEIVARMHYLGKLKQRMFVCQIEGDTSNVSAGDKIYNNLSDRKTVGNIATVVQKSDQLLAVLKLDNINNDLYLEGGQKIKAFDSQPYSIPI